MTENNNTAEQELLKTIEGEEPATVSRSSAVKSLDPSALKSHAMFFADTFKAKLSSGSFSFQPQQINLALFGLLALLVCWLGIVIAQGVGRLNRIPHFSLGDIASRVSTDSQVVIPVQDKTYYDNFFFSRNIFDLVHAKEEAVEVQKTSMIDELVKNLRVVGLSWSDKADERFVMLENTESQLTYFLKEGDTVLKLNVYRIKEESVILTYGSEEIELR